MKSKNLRSRSQSNSILLLEDGSFFRGQAFGAKKTEIGELVFHTSHSGYQEVLTDPSYRKQIVVFTAPHIGNQGFHPDDWESKACWASGVVMRNVVDAGFHWRRRQSLQDFLSEGKTPAMVGPDTRRLVLKLRSSGNMWAVISTETDNIKELQKHFDQKLSMEGLSLVREVSTKTSYTWVTKSLSLMANHVEARSSKGGRCVVMDFGVKRQILRYLLDSGFEEVIVVPSRTSADEIISLSPDALLLSNGPGDPAAENAIIAEVQKLLGRFPIFGICLGHQILALALGLQTYKLKFGHHGANHPVKNLHRDNVEISSQNHGFAVLPSSSDQKIEMTYINLNDQSMAGFRHKSMNVCGIQFHPESSPGPIDSAKLFEYFHENNWEEAFG